MRGGGAAKAELQAFIFRSQVLAVYRQYLRTVRGAPPQARRELLEQVRREFEAGRAAAEPYAQKYALSDARARLKQLREMLGMQR